MSTQPTKLQQVLGSSNFRTDIVTIVIGLILGGVAFFNVIPDLTQAQQLSGNVGEVIIAIKSGAWTAVFAAGLKVWNVISHILKD